MNPDLPNNVVGFSRAACRLGELLASSAGVDPEDAPTAAQWLIPLCEGRGAPETAEGLQDLVTRWNAVTTPHEGPIRYLTRWTAAAA